MIAIDTNVLLRTLVDDSDAPSQCEQARALVKRAGQVRVSLIVFVETLWVLNKRYRASRADVERIAFQLLDHPRYQIEQTDLLRESLAVFASSNVDIADALALVDARRCKVVLHTFDAKLAKLDGAAPMP